MKYEISEKLKKAVDYIEKLIEDGNDFYVIEAEGNIFGICCLNDAEPTVADFNSAGITDKRDIAFFYAYLIATKTCDIMMRITKKKLPNFDVKPSLSDKIRFRKLEKECYFKAYVKRNERVTLNEKVKKILEEQNKLSDEEMTN